MRLLLDNNLSPRLVPLLKAQGWEVEHVGAIGCGQATDEAVLRAAQVRRSVLVSADTDFGQLLAATRASGPSVVLVRRISGRRVEDLAGLLIANLPALERELADGSVVVLGEDTVRVRRLPIG